MGMFSKRKNDRAEDAVAALLSKDGMREAMAGDTTITVVPLGDCDVEVSPFDMFHAELGPPEGGVLVLPGLLWDKVLEQKGQRYVSARLTRQRAEALIADDIRSGVLKALPPTDYDLSVGQRTYLMAEGWGLMIVMAD